MDVVKPDLVVSVNTAANVDINSFVVVLYNNEYYAGQIKAKTETDVQVSCMHKCGDNKFIWPRREDLCWYEYNDVVACTVAPIKYHRYFHFPADAWG